MGSYPIINVYCFVCMRLRMWIVLCDCVLKYIILYNILILSNTLHTDTANVIRTVIQITFTRNVYIK